MADKRADAAAAYAKAPKPPQSDTPAPGRTGSDPGAPGEDPDVVPAADGLVEEPQPDAAPESADQNQAPGEDDGSSQVAQDLDELTAKAEKADEYLVLAQRTQADFENFRKRAAREAALAQERGIAKLAKELLPAIDNLERALQAEVGEGGAQIVDGIKLVQADLLSALSRVGIEPFSPVDEQFNPQLHEAVAQHQVEGKEPGTVIEVYQSGYRLGETVLRPARVLVAA